MSGTADFKLFMALWNRTQGISTPALHFRMADWLEHGERRMLLQAFRSSGKSTVTGLYAAWLLYRAADTRILVLAADALLARKMVRNVKRILERHPLTAHLKPEKLDQWGSDRFTVNRARELRDPSMLARGISSNMTGSRADVIICDDVEVPNTCDGPEKRADLRERLAEIDFVLTPGGSCLYIGTPHTWYTIYAEEPRTEIGETAAFLEGYARLCIPVLEQGESTWPERFSLEDIERIRLGSGPHRFASQMMLEPVNIAEGRLDPAHFVRYEGEPDYLKEIDLTTIGDRKIVSASAWWDPAFGSASGDGSVLAIIFTDEVGHYWLHRVEYLNQRAALRKDDEATAQCKEVVRLIRQFRLPHVTVEINGIGRFLPSILKREIALGQVQSAVRNASSTKAKDLRIIEAFDTVLAARMLHVHASVYKTPFIREVQEWRPGSKGRDDGLDAVAGAISAAPMRLPRHYPGGKQHKADTEFQV